MQICRCTIKFLRLSVGQGEAPIDPSKTIPPVAQTYPVEEQPIQEGMIAPYNPSAETDMRAQNPAVIALLDGAYQQSESGQLDLAASKLERAVRISPRDPQVWSALAKIRLQQKKYALAVSLAKNLIYYRERIKTYNVITGC